MVAETGDVSSAAVSVLAGISLAMVVSKLQQKGWSARQIARKTIWRGFEIFVLGLLFRLQEYVIAWGWAPKSDLFRVDILNTIGVSIILMGVMCWVVGLVPPFRKGREIVAAPTRFIPRALLERTRNRGAVCACFITLTYTACEKVGPPEICDLGGRTCHGDFAGDTAVMDDLANRMAAVAARVVTSTACTIWDTPQPWLFPIFPWTAFAFAGLALGFVLQSDW